MRRIFLALAPAMAIALALAAPGVAFGYGTHHRGRHHKHHHARGARVVNFTPVKGSEGASGEAGNTAAESIGTVSSYEKEVLTIKLTDGSLLSGKVTAETRVICVSSTSTEAGNEGKGFGGYDHSWGGWWHDGGSCAEPSSEEGGTEPTSTAGSGSGWHWSGRGDCAQASKEVNLEKVLVAGATVKEAELRITPEGSAWESVVISR